MRSKITLAALLVVVLALAAWGLTPGSHAQGPVYSPMEVKAGLLRHPRQWVGRTLFVQGTLIDLRQSWAKIPYVVLVPAISPHAPRGVAAQNVRIMLAFAFRGSQMLRLQPPAANPLLSLAQRLPLLNRLVAAAEHASDLRPAIYRIHLLAPNQACAQLLGRWLCYDGFLAGSES